METGVPIDSWKPQFRVIPGNLCSGWLRNPNFRVTLGTHIPVGLREPGVPFDSGNPEFRMTSGTRISGLLQNPDSLVTRNTGFRVTPETRNSGRLGNRSYG